MPKQIEEIPLVSFTLNVHSETPLYKQLYELLQKAILEGRLKHGQRLPGSRSLAAELHVSRNTVALAFNQLLLEGYISGKIGSGTFVNEIPDSLLQAKLKPGDISKKRISSSGKNPLLADRIKKHIKPANPFIKNISGDELIPFQTGTPALNEFPLKTWLRLINKVAQTFSAAQLGYGDAAGYRPLREAIASYLKTYRAVNCNADQVVIVSGSQQGLDLIGRVLLGSTSVVWLEDPGYFGARASMIFSDAGIFPSPLDEEGLDLSYSVKKNPKPDLIYATPSHQFPLGVTMSISRRLNLLQFARKNKCWIIEDDYDSEFRYSGSPFPSLQGLDKSGRVLYLGTFSKVLFPGLRLGYLVLPDAGMVNAFASAKYLIDRQCAIYEQIILTRFLEDGHFTKHIRKMRMLYKSRQDFLVREINKELQGMLNVKPSPAGMHLIGWLPENLNDKEVAEEALKNNIALNALSDYSIKFHRKPGLILGYTAFHEAELKTGTAKLKKVLLKFTV